jgi:hypothetical protein
MSFGICAVIRDEARYLLEWIAYHRCIGVERFVLYDNESSDGTYDLLTRLSDRIDLRRIPWITPDAASPQLSGYADFICAHRLRHDFTLLIDADEFLTLPAPHDSLQGYFAAHGLDDPSIAAIAVNQRAFGSSGHQHLADGPVIARFTRTAPDAYDENRWFKSFIRPADVHAIATAHSVMLRRGRYVDSLGGALDAAALSQGQTSQICGGLRINHYIVKSLEEFRHKQARGGGAGSTAALRQARYNDAFFFGRNVPLNQEEWRFPPAMLAKVQAMAETLGAP